MDSRKTSDGSVSPTAAPNGHQSRSQATTPVVPTFPAMNGPPRSPAIGHSADPWANMPNSAALRAAAASFQPTATGTESMSTRMRYLSIGSTNDVDDTPLIVSSTPAVQMPVGTKSSSSSSSPVHQREWFTTDVDPDKPRRDGLSGHFLQIQGVKKCELNTGMIKFLEDQYTTGIRGKKYLNASEHAEYADVVFFVDDTRTAEEINENLQSQAQITSSFVSFDWYQNGRAAPDRASIEPVSMYVGQLTLTVKYKGCTDDFEASNNSHDLYNKVRAFAARFGELLAFEKTRGVTYPDHQFRVEYYKISNAADAIEQGSSCVQLSEVPGWFVTASQYVPPTHGAAAQHTSAEQNAGQPVLPPPGAQVTTSPTGRTAWWTDENGHTYPCLPPRSLAVVPRESYEPVTAQHYDEPVPSSPVSPRAMVPYAGSHSSIDSVVNANDASTWKDPRDKAAQVVHIERILNGQDVRTTVMMRNVPNNWTRTKLKEKIDQYCHGRYNFMYLRIDFAAGKNVGYAFVNFETAADIVPFVQNMVGKMWEGGPLHFGKPKLVETSYATVQGMDSLIDKFRNSSIMDENSEYRPALIQTPEEKAKDEQEAMKFIRLGIVVPQVIPVGEYKPFPAVNNRAKKDRSTANAGQIGLFSPRNHRNNYYDRFRGRSQFDRGTPAQLAEEWRPPHLPAMPPYPPPPAMPFPTGRTGNMYPPNFGSYDPNTHQFTPVQVSSPRGWPTPQVTVPLPNYASYGFYIPPVRGGTDGNGDSFSGDGQNSGPYSPNGHVRPNSGNGHTVGPQAGNGHIVNGGPRIGNGHVVHVGPHAATTAVISGGPLSGHGLIVNGMPRPVDGQM